MTPIKDANHAGSSKSFIWFALALATLSLALSIGTMAHKTASTGQVRPTEADALAKIRKTGVMHVGYGGFPPYTVIDPKEADPNKRVMGFSVDLVSEIAQKASPPLKIEWHLLSWETLKADMLSGKFDFVADPVFQTIPRAMDFGLCDPYSYFGIACALVRKEENRFKTFGDLDREDITIALAEGWTSSEFARKHLQRPKFKSVSVGGDAFVQLDDVLLGRADVALNDVPTIAQYVKAHPEKVKALWLEKPPAMVGGGFVTRMEDSELREFLNASIRILKADGVLEKIDERWNSYGFFESTPRIPGQALHDKSNSPEKQGQ